jgi:hypothetical protein
VLAEQPIAVPTSVATLSRGLTLDQLDGWKVAQVIFYLFVGFLCYIGRSFILRLEKLESEAVRKGEFEKAHNENKETLLRIEGKIDVAAQATLIEQVREIKATVGKIEVYADGLKHNHIDPYVRAVDVLKSRVDRIEREK